MKAAGLGLVLVGAAMALAPVARALADPAPAPQGDPERGGKLFVSTSCGSCHTLAAAGAMGQVGPTLDANPNLTHALVVDRVANGQAEMPPFGDQLSAQEIADIAAYVMKASAK